MIFHHQHGRWADDYRAMVPALHDPAAGKHVAVAETDDGTISGYVAWKADPARRHGDVVMLAVADAHRRGHIGTALCQRAFDDMTRKDVQVVTIGTGGTDSFHAPARALYESMGVCTGAGRLLLQTDVNHAAPAIAPIPDRLSGIGAMRPSRQHAPRVLRR